MNADRSDQQGKNKEKIVHLVDEQAIMLEAFRLCFATEPDQEVVGFMGDATIESLDRTVSDLVPDVVLMGVDTVELSTVQKLGAIRERNPKTAIVLLFGHCDEKGVEALRELSRGAEAGYAYLLMDTIDTQEQLARVMSLVSGGRVIIDPTVMDGLMGPVRPDSTLHTETIPWEPPLSESELRLWISRN